MVSEKINKLKIDYSKKYKGIYDYFIDGVPLSDLLQGDGGPEYLEPQSCTSIFDFARDHAREEPSSVEYTAKAIVYRAMLPKKAEIVDFPVYECPLCLECSGYMFKVGIESGNIVWYDFGYSNLGEYSDNHDGDGEYDGWPDFASARKRVGRLVFDYSQYVEAIEKGLHLAIDGKE
jgi:hypothetical protein